MWKSQLLLPLLCTWKLRFLFFAEFTKAQNSLQCIRLRGSCRSGSCPSGMARIGTCSGSDSCCLP
uniref:Beta-defensin-like domain-containing protein n=1 Tax=Chelonoidis abingdonii TaxID=106734 RepID=A0A8C0HIY0_CHEAB